MQYKAILVDDEVWILEGLLRIFPWKKYNFEVVGKFMDAEEAYEYIRLNPVDLVVTDIRMPEVSGLDLLRQCRQQGMDCEFVIVSGYSEFEYARTALRDDAFDYCLKPIKTTDAENLLIRLCEHLEKKRDRQDKELLEIVQQSCGFEQAFKCRNLPTIGTCYIPVMIYRLTREKHDLLVEWLYDFRHLILRIGLDKALCLINGDKPSLERAITKLQTWQRQSKCIIGVGRQTDTPGDDSIRMKEADMAANAHFIDPDCSFQYFRCGDTGTVQGIVRTFSLAMHNGDIPLLQQVLSSVPKLFVRESLGVYHAQILWNQLVMIVSTKQSQHAAYALELQDYEELTSTFITIDEMCKYLIEVVSELLTRNPHRSASGTNENFLHLCEYVRTHYCEKLSISDLSERFYLNMTYCCELFKQKTGQTFSEYVTSLRMEKAVELLRQSQLSLQDIAFSIGYNDYFYFSKSFKKYYGMTPTQYSKKNEK